MVANLYRIAARCLTATELILSEQPVNEKAAANIACYFLIVEEPLADDLAVYQPLL